MEKKKNRQEIKDRFADEEALEPLEQHMEENAELDDLDDLDPDDPLENEKRMRLKKYANRINGIW